ncbi:Sec-independent protein translocase protein TatB [Bartonella tamiae]|uniref:Sec-independent protein translocase protein TatB n=1 Tax=Bartonella tamiae Th239 TaxID=1094558 RepID=J1JZX9_9HYPH|nr:Sec-independent protein translocase protein TatB [Bartonella tamiae]EJF90697.1 twin arginine-targeting protein translocase TatB [Bartonella tamiae Th239]
MFGIDGPEFLVILIVLIVVVGPKDLPKMLRAFGKATSRMRSTANEFRRQFDDAMREAELDDLQKKISDVTDLDPRKNLTKMFDPIRDVANDVKSSINASTVLDDKTPSLKNISLEDSEAAQQSSLKKKNEKTSHDTSPNKDKNSQKKVSHITHEKLPAPNNKTLKSQKTKDVTKITTKAKASVGQNKKQNIHKETSSHAPLKVHVQSLEQSHFDTLSPSVKKHVQKEPIKKNNDVENKKLGLNETTSAVQKTKAKAQKPLKTLSSNKVTQNRNKKS